jgi:N-methylhydantoinase A/oxoprolinase/acetone carboxylase beta subunit
MARVGADIGGTFTDVVLEAGGQVHSAKVLTDYEAPERAVAAGVIEVCRQSSVPPEHIAQVIHGTTLATNALIARRGARTALATTDGFRDVIEMRTESRFEQYDLNLVLPEPLLPRTQRITVSERLDADGGILVPLDEGEVERVCEVLVAGAYESVAVGLLHAYANPVHEERLRDAIRAAMPGVPVSLSSEVSPQMREYERFNTTVANAYVQPLMAGYLERLEGALAAVGTDCPVYLIHSGGGLMSLEDAARFPVRLVESGPAGGAVFAAGIAARHGIGRALSFDMGGTTAKLCLVRDAAPRTARVFEVARSYRYKKGSGMPISIPVIEMVEIGAGGGSLASVDALGRLNVGPESAGSEPGPACYGRGGTRAAVTDADLRLGRLDAEGFAGGRIGLDEAAAEAALVRDAGAPLGLDETEAAQAVSEVVDESMAGAARMHAVETGEDVSSHVMIAFGGAAPLHAVRLCEKLGIARCLVPAGAGVGSAIGFLRTPFAFEATRTRFARLGEIDAALAEETFATLEAEAEGFVAACAPGEEIETSHRVFMRYRGQGWEIPVALPPAESRLPGVWLPRFEDEYRALFGRLVPGAEAEITVWAVTAQVPVPAPSPAPPTPHGARVMARASRRMWDGDGMAEAAEVAREEMEPGALIDGPAAVVEDETATILPSGWGARMLADGTLELRREEGR